ncbi:MAG: sel1 repeat family protein [Alphaproteobacteria bacterium]|nr:sel1 repeat family protein [Alphaproteobacteria bacterium]
MRAWIIALVLLLTPVAASGEDAWQEGWDAYLRGDFATALSTWRPLAEQGHALAQASLGDMYANGEGVPQDDAEAVKWYRLAAERGLAEAQFGLGFMYYHGRGVPQDDVEAVKWFRLAAEQGLAQAQVNLGAMYAIGQGVPQDYVQAHMWLNLGGSAGYADSVKHRDTIAALMTPNQIAEARRLANEWIAAHPPQ